MSDYPSMDRIAELQQLIADFAKVKRKVTLADNGWFENDVEHSYGLTLTCWFLQPKIAPDLDLFEILKLALAHNIVEIHAGDTYFQDKEAVALKDKRERAAAKQIRHDWNDFTELSKYAELYMDKATEEARFVKAVDKLLPLLMLGLGEGLEAHKKRYDLTLEKLKENKKSLHVHESLSPYYDKLFVWLEKTEANRQ